MEPSSDWGYPEREGRQMKPNVEDAEILREKGISKKARDM